MPSKETPLKETSKLWVEKYRPRAITDVAHQTQVVNTLQKAVKESAGRGDLPHLLFYGPPGTGKTSTALALCRDLFGPHNLRSRVLELNASDERGIKVVRDKIKNFAQGAVATPGGNGTSGYPCPPFKVIVLDEADAITMDAQTALRRTMEAHSKVTRFIIICNYISRIIDPLTSRCAKFRFNPLPMSSMLKYIKKVASGERVVASDDTLKGLIEASEGDLRKAINTLQSAHRMLEPGSSLNMDDISAAACLVPESVVNDFDLATCKPSASNAAVRAAVDDIIRQGLSSLQLLSQYADKLQGGGNSNGIARLDDVQRSAVAIVIADAEKAIIDGCDEQIQLYSVASRISVIAAVNNNIDALIAV